MTQAALPLERTSDTRVIAVVSAAHFVSHYYILLLPPLFGFIRADYGLDYTQVSLALTAFNVTSAALQTPAGFVVDRLGARMVLILGLALGAAAFAVAAAVDSFWVLVAMFGVAGIANTAYHPADYAILSHQVSRERISHAFSVHTFAGILGSALAPASLLFMASFAGWRGAFYGAAALGFAVALLLVFQGGSLADRKARTPDAPAPKAADKAVGWRLLLSGPIVRNLVFFVLLAVGNAGIQNYSVVGLQALYGTSAELANTSLSAYLLLGAIGVLAGGVLATRIPRHGAVAAIGLLLTGVAAVLVGLVDLPALALVAAMAAAGFFNGVVMPSRDMIVREVTPPGSFGRVFGFVTTGFNIGGVFSPLLFGLLIDHGAPRAIFLTTGICALLSIFTVLTRPGRRV